MFATSWIYKNTQGDFIRGINKSVILGDNGRSKENSVSSIELVLYYFEGYYSQWLSQKVEMTPKVNICMKDGNKIE